MTSEGLASVSCPAEIRAGHSTAVSNRKSRTPHALRERARPAHGGPAAHARRIAVNIARLPELLEP